MVRGEISKLLIDYLTINGIKDYSEFSPYEAMSYVYAHLSMERFTSLHEAETYIASFPELAALLEIFEVTIQPKVPNTITIANDLYFISARRLITVETISSMAFDLLNRQITL